MATIPETNQKLWSTLRRIYTAQRYTAEDAVAELAALGETHPDLAKDPIARDELKSALSRQRGHLRFAESQLTLVNVMSGYLDQRSSDPVPDVSYASGPNSNLLSAAIAPGPLASRITSSHVPERAVGGRRA